jgi:hypothetical protein
MDDPYPELKELCLEILSRLDAQKAQTEDQMADIRRSIAEIRTLYEAHHRRLDGMDESLTRINHELWGNGRAGLSVQVRAILWIASGTLGFLVILAAEVFSKWL